MAQRPRRSGAQRRAQYERGQARVIGRLLKSFATLQHRGCCNTKLGTALAQVLCAAPAAAAAPYPVMPPGTFFAAEPSPAPQALPVLSQGVWEPIPTTSWVQSATAAPNSSPEQQQPPTAATRSLYEELVYTFNSEILRMQAEQPAARDRQRQARLCNVIGIIELLEMAAA